MHIPYLEFLHATFIETDKLVDDNKIKIRLLFNIDKRDIDDTFILDSIIRMDKPFFYIKCKITIENIIPTIYFNKYHYDVYITYYVVVDNIVKEIIKSEKNVFFYNIYNISKKYV